jgi:beta-galactosidase
LYTASDEVLERLNTFVHAGGHIVYTFKSGFADQHVKVRTVPQPGIISEACGITYSMFVEPHDVSLKDDPFQVGNEQNGVDTWMELITPTTAEVLAWYNHAHWGMYAAITKNRYGNGTTTYIGCLVSAAVMAKVLEQAVKDAGCWGLDQALSFPFITRSGINVEGKAIHYYFNYSDAPGSITYPHDDGRELITDSIIRQGQEQRIDAWGMLIIEQLNGLSSSIR